MSLSVTIDAAAVTGELSRRIDALRGSGLAGLHLAMITEVQQVTESHLMALAATRHKTAMSLGAAPSGHLAQAAEKVGAADSIAADEQAGTLSLNHVGMARAFRDVTIAPTGGRKFLAIPIHALAYNRRCGQLWDSLHLFVVPHTRVVAMKRGEEIVPLYLLLRQVTQKQDRTLLPSDRQFRDAALLGANRHVQAA